MKTRIHLTLITIMSLLVEQLNAQEMLDYTGKKITAYIVYNVVDHLKSKEPGEKLLVKTENYKAIENDFAAWSRMTGHPVIIIESKDNYTIYEFTNGGKVNNGKKFAIVVSDNGLEELLSPLGLAISCGISGYDVNIYFQGPAVRVLKKGFKEKLPGLNSIFSGFARNGLKKTGHVPAQEKLKVLQELGAKFYVCQPSMEHFGVKEKDFAFDGLTLCEYLTFLEVYNTADLKFFLQ